MDSSVALRGDMGSLAHMHGTWTNHTARKGLVSRHGGTSMNYSVGTNKLARAAYACTHGIPQSHALLHDWGPGRSRTVDPRRMDGARARGVRHKSKPVFVRPSCTGSAAVTGPSAPRPRRAAEPTRLRGPPPRPIAQPSRSLAPGSIDARRARRGGSDGEAARAATARRPTWPRTPLVPRILPPLPFPLLQPITSSRRRAAVCRSAPSSLRSSPPNELYKFLCIILLYTYWTPSSQWSRPGRQARLASPLVQEMKSYSC